MKICHGEAPPLSARRPRAAGVLSPATRAGTVAEHRAGREATSALLVLSQ